MLSNEAIAAIRKDYTLKEFDDFAGTGSNEDFNRKILGI